MMMACAIYAKQLHTAAARYLSFNHPLRLGQVMNTQKAANTRKAANTQTHACWADTYTERETLTPVTVNHYSSAEGLYVYSQPPVRLQPASLYVYSQPPVRLQPASLYVYSQPACTSTASQPATHRGMPDTERHHQQLMMLRPSLVITCYLRTACTTALCHNRFLH
jgi:hypothetical protein